MCINNHNKKVAFIDFCRHAFIIIGPFYQSFLNYRNVFTVLISQNIPTPVYNVTWSPTKTDENEYPLLETMMTMKPESGYG